MFLSRWELDLTVKISPHPFLDFEIYLWMDGFLASIGLFRHLLRASVTGRSFSDFWTTRSKEQISALTRLYRVDCPTWMMSKSLFSYLISLLYHWWRHEYNDQRQVIPSEYCTNAESGRERKRELFETSPHPNNTLIDLLFSLKDAVNLWTHYETLFSGLSSG